MSILSRLLAALAVVVSFASPGLGDGIGGAGIGGWDGIGSGVGSPNGIASGGFNPPTANGVVPTLFADFTTQGTSNHYWFNGVRYPAGFAAWQTAMGGTFSRPSHATQYDVTGNLTYAPNNVALQSNTLNVTWASAMTLAQNVVSPDGTTDGWSATSGASATLNQSVSLNQTTASMFSFYARYVSGANTNIVLQIFSATPNGGRAWFNIQNGTAGTKATFGTGTNVSSTITAVGNGWYRASVVVTPNGADTSYTVEIDQSNADNSFAQTSGSVQNYFGGQVEQVTYQTTPSVYKPTTTTASFGPRFDYNPATKAARGLLIEATSTNLALQSNTFSTTWVTAANTAVTAGASASPDGTTDGWSLTETTTTVAVHTTTQAFVKAASALVYTATVFGRFNQRQRIEVQLNDNAGNGAFTVCDLNGGQIGVAATGLGTAFTGLSSTITLTAASYYQCSLTATSNTATALNMVLGIDGGSGTAARTNSYAGIPSEGISIYGAQLEQAAFASSYIPTAAATVARAADIVTTGVAETATGTAQAGADNVTTNSNAPRIVGTASGGSSRTALTLSGGTTPTIFNGTVALLTANTVSSGVPARMASSWDGTGRSIALSAGAVATDANTQPTGSTFVLGEDGTGPASFLEGHIQQVGIWTTVRASNAELQRLSQ